GGGGRGGGGEEPRRDAGRDDVRRAGPQVSDLGARTLPRRTRGGHREGPRAQEATGLPGSGGRRSTGMTAGPGSTPAVAGGAGRAHSPRPPPPPAGPLLPPRAPRLRLHPP